MSDWEDRKTRKVVVPATMEGQRMPHGVSRNMKHMSVIACVSSAGESLPLYVVMSQLRKRGVRFGRDLILKSNSRPYVNAEIFPDFIGSVFLKAFMRMITRFVTSLQFCIWNKRLMEL
jgi:hypothetical protein